MDGPALSGRERRLLEEIESDLRQDARLNRRLSTMGVKRPGRVRGGLSRLWHRLPAGVVMTALVMSAICLSIGVRTPTVPVLTAVVLVWTVSVAVAAVVALLLRRRRRAAGIPPEGLLGGDRPDGRERPDGRDRPEGRERRPWDRPEA
ncbi:hypothetical protein ACFWA9_34045 [Kitasatospora sp. NPDC059973]|uniref:hypothetical protein n=1 Tax=unclassified Kitasatospora TaxID=2633591 RepID=UPI00331CB534